MKQLKLLAACALLVHAIHAADDANQDRALIERAKVVSESFGQLAIDGLRPSQVFADIAACLSVLRERHEDLKNRIETVGASVQLLEIQAAQTREQSAAVAAILGCLSPSPSSSSTLHPLMPTHSNAEQGNPEVRPSKRIESIGMSYSDEEQAKRQRTLDDSRKVYCDVCDASYMSISKHRKTLTHLAKAQGQPLPVRSTKPRDGGPFCDICSVTCSNLSMHRKTKFHLANAASRLVGQSTASGSSQSSISPTHIENE